MHSNCGNPLKPMLPSHSSQSGGGRFVTAGRVKMHSDETMCNPQPSLSRKVEGKVQRLDGCGSFLRKDGWSKVIVRPPRNGSLDRSLREGPKSRGVCMQSLPGVRPGNDDGDGRRWISVPQG